MFEFFNMCGNPAEIKLDVEGFQQRRFSLPGKELESRRGSFRRNGSFWHRICYSMLFSAVFALREAPALHSLSGDHSMKRLILAGAIVMLSAATSFGGNIVVNGGFETGDFTSWTWQPSAMGGSAGVDISGAYAHSGNAAAALGPYGTDGFLSQILSTTAGTPYELTYWLANVPDGSGNVWNNDFECSWNGGEILASALTNAGPFGYTQYSYVVTAASSSSSISFGLRQDARFFTLDDVSVSTIPEPATLLLVGTGALGIFGIICRRRMK